MKDVLIAFVHVFAMMSPWLVFGFLMAGVIAVWIPRNWVNRMMGGSSGFGGILRAVAIGVPLPICSCGVLPIAAGLRKHGAGKGPTAALLISTPQTGVDSILATYALLGPVFAVARPVAAALTGIVGGAVVSAVGGEDAAAVSVEEESAGSRGIKAIFWQAYRRLLGSVAKPLAVGLAVSALVTVLVPDNFFADAFHGSDWIAMPVMALVGFPMYVYKPFAMFFNASPRKNWNTYKMLEAAKAGAEEAGATTELVNLYDIKFPGCKSGFACKLKNAKTDGVCAIRDDLRPILERARKADVLVLGSPIYFGYPTGVYRAFLERLAFPVYSYHYENGQPLVSTHAWTPYCWLNGPVARQLDRARSARRKTPSRDDSSTSHSSIPGGTR